MKAARALASGMLVLAAVCAVPAISAAQDGVTTTTTDATTTTTAAPGPAPGDPGAASGEAVSTQPDAPSTGPVAGTSHEAASDSGETTADLRRAAPPDGPGRGAQKSASASVTMRDFFFSPASVTVAVGDTVTWRNTGEAPHNATADDGSFRTPDLNNGQSSSHTFNSSGTFSYICTIHPNMKGTVRVLSSSSGRGGGGEGGTDTSATGDTEAGAVASPDAAGDANTLPMTGMAAGALALVGLALVASGLLMRRWLTF